MTLVLIGTNGFFNRRLWRLIVETGVVVNLAYLAGPAIETCLKWWGYERTWPRWILSVGGTLLALVLMIGALATALLPDQD